MTTFPIGLLKIFVGDTEHRSLMNTLAAYKLNR